MEVPFIPISFTYDDIGKNVKSYIKVDRNVDTHGN